MPQTNETIFVTTELKIKTNIERELLRSKLSNSFA